MIDFLSVKSNKPFFVELLKTFGIMTLVILISLGLYGIGFTETNIILLFIMGVLFVSILTTGYLYGIIASVIGVVSYNFFFVAPRFTFSAYGTQYPLTFIVMLIVASVTSTLTTRTRIQARYSAIREKRSEILYQISRSLLRARGSSEVAEIATKHILKLLNRSVIYYFAGSKNELSSPYIQQYDIEKMDVLLSEKEKNIAHWVFINKQPGGCGTEAFSGAGAFYLPVVGLRSVLGVVAVACVDGNPLEQEQRSILESVVAQIALTMEREQLSEEQQLAKLEVERERLRSNLLRAVSHDLRSPLTGISGAASTLLENGDLLDDVIKKNMLRDIYDDTEWLIRLVENLLSVTRIDEGNFRVKKNMEAVEEVVSEAIQRIKKRAGNHIIKSKIPDELIIIPMDGNLIEQVLVNLIDNAVKYTPDGSVIEVNVRKDNESIEFEVADNGQGIADKDLPQVFDRFFTSGSRSNDSRRGIGLGLAICKSIINAHNGRIQVSNREGGGAVFTFSLPAG